MLVETPDIPVAQEAITAGRVRYIKLGAGGSWEEECLAQSYIRYGFNSGTAERYPICLKGDWDRLRDSFLAEGCNARTATNFTNETRFFFEDAGETLWITFVGERLLWGKLTPDAPVPHPEGNSVVRKIDGGWCDTDLNGEQLRKDNLSGALTKVVGYKGTSCNVDLKDYVLRRVNGLKVPEVERGIAAFGEMTAATLGMIRLLGPKDFEILVDLIFSTSGWRRLGVVGKTQKTLDLDLILPSTGERAFVQVKSRTDSKQLADYVSRIDDADEFSRMFYVYHTGHAETNDQRVVVIGPEKVAEMAVEAGLVGWLIRKVS